MLDTILQHLVPVIPELIAAIVAVVLGFAVKKKWINEQLSTELHSDVSGAVTEVYHEYVGELKKTSADGKLTEEQKKIARDKAVSKITEIGKTKGIDYAKKYGLPLIVSLIETYVTKKKTATE
jgi:hypothetical protein